MTVDFPLQTPLEPLRPPTHESRRARLIRSYHLSVVPKEESSP